MDTLELAPGKGLGLFHLGDTLWHVLDVLRARKTDVPKLEISWDPDNAHKSAVTVHAGPVALLFPHDSGQRLSLIQVAGLDRAALTLTYESTVLASPSHPLTRAGVARALGPTYGDGSARLAYPGVGFELSPTGGREDLVASVVVTPREEGVLPTVEPLEKVTIQPGRGVTLSLPHAVEVILGQTTAQDLLLDLGPPLRKYWKEDERLGRVWGKEHEANDDQGSPTACFWNYFQHGLDFLIDDGLVTKVIAHSNIPGTPEFQQYARCPWVLPTDSDDLDFVSPIASFRSHLGSSDTHLAVPSTEPPRTGTSPPNKEKGKGKRKGKASGGDSSSPSRLDTPDEPQDAPAATTRDAMILDRTVEGGLDGVVGVGKSQLVGFDGLVVEVDEATGSIASVQVWTSKEE